MVSVVTTAQGNGQNKTTLLSPGWQLLDPATWGPEWRAFVEGNIAPLLRAHLRPEDYRNRGYPDLEVVF